MIDIGTLLTHLLGAQKQAPAPSTLGDLLRNIPTLSPGFTGQAPMRPMRPMARSRQAPAYTGPLGLPWGTMGAGAQLPMHGMTPEFVGLLGSIRAKKEAALNPMYAKGLSGSRKSKA